MGGSHKQDFVEAVRAAGDIVQLVSEYVPLKKGGSRFKGLCPFHQEKTPSFSVDPERQLFYCFGCQTGGDVFKFVMLYEKLDFPETLDLLARRWGVPRPASRFPRTDDPRERTLEINEAASRRFREQLASPGGSSCRRYLAKRGLDEATIERLGIGYAPESWDALRDHLFAKKFSPKEMIRAGLVLARKNGSGEYDRFRDRLMFPIRDVYGKSVAFGGRAIGEAEPKYINSPETPAYTKGDQLYGLDLAREAIRREGMAIVVEGYLDLAALVQAGIENVVASLGTAFTPAQARLLARLTQRVLVAYDGDAAGAAATARSLDMLLEKGFEIRVIELPGGMDPDDFIRQEGAEAFGRKARQAPDYLQYLVQQQAETRDLDNVKEKIAAVNSVLPHVAKLSSAIERVSWATRLADAFRIDEGLVMQELRQVLKAAQTKVRYRPSNTRDPRQAEARLVNLLLRSEDERRCCVDELDWDWADLEGTVVVGIVREILRRTSTGESIDHPELLAALDDEADKELLTRIAFVDEPEDGPSVEDCLWAFKRQRLTREGRAVRRRIGAKLKTEPMPAAAEAALAAEDATADAPGAPNPQDDPDDVDAELMRLQQLARQRDALM